MGERERGRKEKNRVRERGGWGDQGMERKKQITEGKDATSFDI